MTPSRGHAIDATSGALTATPNSPFQSSGSGLSSLALSPDGKFAYSANSGSGNLTIFNVGATTGALTPASTFVPAGTHPHLIAVESGQSAYVVTSFGIDAYALDPATGGFSDSIGLGVRPGALVLDVYGRFAFAIRNGTVETYWTFIGPGAITGPVGTPPAVGVNASSLAVHPSGLFVYVANADPSGTIQEFVVKTTGYGSDVGTLTPVGAPTPAGSAPLSVVVDPTGLFLYERIAALTPSRDMR